MPMRRVMYATFAFAICVWPAAIVAENAEQPPEGARQDGPLDASPGEFRLTNSAEPGTALLASSAGAKPAAADPQETEQASDVTAAPEEAGAFDLSYDLTGPYRLRSADPEEAGELEVKNIFGWSTTRGGGDDDFEYALEIEWGIVENHELIFEVPVELGDGRVDGNADLELGWHWRLWKEQDWLPAVGMRNFIRVPTGVDSSGVDYEWIGLITKSIVPGKLRFNANPFIKSVNGDNEEDARNFLWGGSFGLDWRVREDLILVGLYRYETGETEGTRDNHSLELGADWKLDERQEIGLAAEIGLDGDSEGPAFGAKISYILSF